MSYQAQRLKDEILAIGQMAADAGGLALAQKYMSDPLGKERLLADLGQRAARIDRKRRMLEPPRAVRGLPLAHVDDEYSLADLILAEAKSRALGNHVKGASLERDISTDLQRYTWNVPSFGTTIPFSIFERDFNVGTASQAGNLTGSATDLSLAPTMFETDSVLGRAGATVLTGLRETLILPRLGPKIVTTEPGWVSEVAAAPAVSEISDELSLHPKRVAATFIVSLQTLKQTGAAGEALLRREIGARVMAKLDAYALSTDDGTGDVPEGLLSPPTGVSQVIGGTNGATLTNQHLGDMEYYGIQQGITPRSGWIVNPNTLIWLRPELSGSRHFDFTHPGGWLWGYPTHVTGHLSSTLTKGTSSDCSGLAFSSDWGQFVIAVYGPGVDLTVDKVTMADTGKVRITAAVYANWGPNKPGAFAVMNDALLPTV